ncbi:MAG: acylphosphatase [Planctomycetota bacterium]
MKRLRLRFTGHVQGVGFRASTQGIARGFAVTGWVHNDPDGSVTMEIQGEAAVIEEFLMEIDAQLGGYVHNTDRGDTAVLEGEAGFEVRA